MIEQNKLPGKYLVKTNKEHPLWNKFAEYINTKRSSNYCSLNFEYYGEDNNQVVKYDAICIDIIRNYPSLTLEEWDSIVNPKFILPEKWVLRRTEENSLIVNEWSNKTHKDNLYSIVDKDYIYSDRRCISMVKEGYTEITFDQFKEYVLNKTNNNMIFKVNDRVKIKKDSKWYKEGTKNNPNNIEGSITKIDNYNDLNIYVNWDNGGDNAYTVKDLELIDNMSNNTNQEIIGYKCPIDLFKGRVKAGSIFSEKSRDGFVMYNISHLTSGVAIEIVETWEPVYKPKYQLPEINGYSGKLEDTQIIYGCAKFDKNYLFNTLSEILRYNNKILEKDFGNRSIKSIVLESGVSIHIDQIKQIVDYINANKN